MAAAHLTDATYAKEVSQFAGLVLVDYWAAWCTPCKAMEQPIEELATKYQDNPAVKIVKLNVDENEQTAMDERVLSLPTFKLFRGGEVIDELIGAVPGERLDQMITRHLAPAA
jgi:thioredoxin 1